MVNELCGYSGNLTEDSLKKILSLDITSISLREGDVKHPKYDWRTYRGPLLEFIFEDNSILYLYDDGQSCCENRYMTTDDDLTSYKDIKIVNIETASMDTIEDPEDRYSEPHEQMSLKITFNDGSGLTAVTHNEHNGYYGGFSLIAIYNEAE
jgi:hypothetical protein